MPSPSHHRSPAKSSPAHHPKGKMSHKKDPSPISSSSATSSDSDAAMAAYFSDVVKSPFRLKEDEDDPLLASYGYDGGTSSSNSNDFYNCFRPRTLPIEVDEHVSLLMELEEDCLMCGNDSEEQELHNQPGHRQVNCQRGNKRNFGDDEEVRLARHLSELYKEDKNALQASLQVPARILNNFKNSISCLTCRKKMDVVRNLIMESNCNALCPLVIVKDEAEEAIVTLDREHFSMIEHRSGVLANVLTKQVKVLEEVYQNRHYINRKSGRCSYHTISGTKQHQSGVGGQNVEVFAEALGCMSDRCVEALCTVSVAAFNDELNEYLRKHSFCVECKSMVTSAYDLLKENKSAPNTTSTCGGGGSATTTKTEGKLCEEHKDSHSHAPPSSPASSTSSSSSSSSGGDPPSSPAGGKTTTTPPALSKKQQHQNELYKGLKVVMDSETGKAERLEFRTDFRYLESVVTMAETELKGQKRERHAKTIDAAQREILTCVGIFIYERFTKCYKLLGEYNQVCEQLVMVSLKALKYAVDERICQINGPRDILFLEEMDRDEEAAKAKQARKKEKKMKQLEKKRQNQKEVEEEKLLKALEEKERLEKAEEERKVLAAEKLARKKALAEEKKQRIAEMQEAEKILAAVKKREEEADKENSSAAMKSNNNRKRLSEAGLPGVKSQQRQQQPVIKRRVTNPFFVSLVQYDAGQVKLAWVENVDCKISDDEIEDFRERHQQYKWHDKLDAKISQFENKLSQYNLRC